MSHTCSGFAVIKWVVFLFKVRVQVPPLKVTRAQSFLQSVWLTCDKQTDTPLNKHWSAAEKALVLI